MKHFPLVGKNIGFVKYNGNCFKIIFILYE